MIIGVSGKTGSGKDTIGKIIQYLINENQISNSSRYSPTFEQFCDPRYASLIGEPSWKIKKFAGKLKEVCSLLTGIPVEDFEKQEVKDRILGEEWTRYGYANGFSKVYRNGEEEIIMNNKQCSKERYKEELRINWQTAYKHQYTVREILQLVGTDTMRNVIHEDVWVNALFADYVKRTCDEETGIQWGHYEYPNWIVTDVRFPNEADAIKSRGGLLIRVNRNRELRDPEGFVAEAIGTGLHGLVAPMPLGKELYDKAVRDQHPSEISLDNYQFDEVVDNNGSMKQLLIKLKTLLIKNKVL